MQDLLLGPEETKKPKYEFKDPYWSNKEARHIMATIEYPNGTKATASIQDPGDGSNPDFQRIIKEFGEDENMIMPTMSLCFWDPFLVDKFDNGELGLNVSYLQYKDFLLGRTWDKKMLGINFENVTKRIEDYLVGLICDFWS